MSNLTPEREDARRIAELEALEQFGLNPFTTGNRPRSFWLVDEIGEEEESAGAQIGDLCVCTRDGGSNPMCGQCLKYDNFRGTAEDNGDQTYRYYYFFPRQGLRLSSDETRETLSLERRAFAVLERAGRTGELNPDNSALEILVKDAEAH